MAANDNNAPHPSVFIAEELAARGWTLDMLAMRMGPEFGVNRLSLDLYFEVGPTDQNLRIGDISANALARALSVSPEYFLNLERAWLNGAPPKDPT